MIQYIKNRFFGYAGKPSRLTAKRPIKWYALIHPDVMAAIHELGHKIIPIPADLRARFL